MEHKLTLKQSTGGREGRRSCQDNNFRIVLNPILNILLEPLGCCGA